MFGDCGFKTGLELSGHRSGRECFGTGNGMQQDIKVRLWIPAFSVPFNGPITVTSCRLFTFHVEITIDYLPNEMSLVFKELVHF